MSWRSLLYVPAHVPRFVAKAAQAGADAVLLDLEDSVPASEKMRARSALADAVPQAGAGGAEVFVRVNRPLAQAVPDIEAAAAAGAAGILLTKTLGAEHVQLVAELLAACERRPMRILPMIETAAALPRMEAVAAASPRVAGLLVGAEDLAAECGATPDGELMVAAKLRAVFAAVAAGIPPLGTLGTVAEYRDAEAVGRLARRSRQAGFAGASCIHPSLVPVLNAAFAPTAAEVDLAERQLAAAAEAERAGRGAFVVDGMMVDEPVLARARRLLARRPQEKDGPAAG